VNATCLLLTGLMAGADTHAPPVAAAAPVVVSTGAGCNGCGPTVAHAPYAYANKQPATLVDWMKAKSAAPSKPGLLARLCGRNAKPAAAPVAHNPCCDPCATGVVSHGGVIVGTPGTVVTPGTTTPPAGGGAGIPKDMPKVVPPKDLPKDPPKTGGSDATPPKTGTPPPPKSGAISVPPLPVIPTSGTNSPY
jgi:hypothetical protein